MAEKKVKVKVDVETNVEQSIAGLKELKKQLKETAAGSAEFKRLANEIDDLEDKIKGSKQGAADWIDTLESAGGPLGAVGAALNKAKVATQSFSGALKATGIGLVVAAIGGLVAAFSQSEKATKKLQPLLIGLEKILGGIFAAVEPLFDAFIDLATKALPYVTKGISVAYSAITSFLQGIGKLGQAVSKLIKGDFTGAWETAKTSVTEFGKRYEESNKRFVEGTKEVTKTEKEELEKRKKAQEEAAKKAEERRKEHLAKVKEANEAEIEAYKSTLSEREKEEFEAGLKLAEQKKKFAEAGRTDVKVLEEAYRKELSDIKKKYDDKDKEDADKAAKEELTKQSLALQLKKEQGLISEAEYQQQLYDIKKQYATTDDEIVQAEIDRQKYKNEERKKTAEEERGILLTNLQSKFEALDAENERIDGDFQADLERFQQQKDILAEQEATELSNAELTEFQKTEIRKKYADARKGISDQEIATEKAAMEAKHEINMAYLGLFEQFGNLLGQIAGKNKGLAIAGIVISQAAAIGQIIANTAIANAKAVAASPLTVGQPWVAINTISAGLSIASTIASAAKSIQQINSASENSTSAPAAGGATLPTPPTPPRVGGVSAPQISTGGGANPTAQIAETISAAQKPLKAYVVSGDVSSQQALDRRTSRAATFSAG